MYDALMQTGVIDSSTSHPASTQLNGRKRLAEHWRYVCVLPLARRFAMLLANVHFLAAAV
jgi:hypothetical protein